MNIHSNQSFWDVLMRIPGSNVSSMALTLLDPCRPSHRRRVASHCNKQTLQRYFRFLVPEVGQVLQALRDQLQRINAILRIQIPAGSREVPAPSKNVVDPNPMVLWCLVPCFLFPHPQGFPVLSCLIRSGGRTLQAVVHPEWRREPCHWSPSLGTLPWSKIREAWKLDFLDLQ